MEQKIFLFELNENPPFFKNLTYGLQWLIMAVPNIVVFSSLCATALGFDHLTQVSFSQRLLFATGLLTLLQSLIGHRYPLIEGPSAALLLSFLVLAPLGLSFIEGGMIFGGIFLIILPMLNLSKRIFALFTPNVVGVSLILVSLTLLPFLSPILIGVDQLHPDGILIIGVFSLLIILFSSLFSYWFKGFLQSTSMLMGIFLGLLFFFIKGDLSLTKIREASWFSLPSPMFGEWPTFSAIPILMMVLTYLAVMINSIGSIKGISEVVGGEILEQRIKKGIFITGIGGLLTAILGVVGLVSYSISPGVVLATRVASRFSLTMAGGIMILSSLMPKLWCFFCLIPPSVPAAVLFVILSIQFMSGMTIIFSKKEMISKRDYFIIGIPLLAGCTVSILPKTFFTLFPASLGPLINNGLVIGILLTLFLEHGMFKSFSKKNSSSESR